MPNVKGKTPAERKRYFPSEDSLVEPWERQSKESPQAYEAFATYRDLGITRSQAKVCQQLGKSRALICEWAASWGWVERVRAYEAAIEREIIAKKNAEIIAMRSRHAEAARLMITKAFDRLKDIEVDTLPIDEVRKYLTAAIKLERMALGEPETIVENRETFSDPQESVDPRDELTRLLDGIKKRSRETEVDSESHEVGS